MVSGLVAAAIRELTIANSKFVNEYAADSLRALPGLSEYQAVFQIARARARPGGFLVSQMLTAPAVGEREFVGESQRDRFRSKDAAQRPADPVERCTRERCRKRLR